MQRITEEDYYKILNVPRTATETEINKAYKKLAVKYHPDKNPESKELAEENFKKVSEAYEVLSNQQKRATYDQMGKAGLQQGGMGGGGFSSQQAEEIFSQFFGGQDPFSVLFVATTVAPALTITTTVPPRATSRSATLSTASHSSTHPVATATTLPVTTHLASPPSTPTALSSNLGSATLTHAHLATALATCTALAAASTTTFATALAASAFPPPPHDPSFTWLAISPAATAHSALATLTTTLSALTANTAPALTAPTITRSATAAAHAANHLLPIRRLHAHACTQL